jgi:hypothetical protein
MCTGGKCTIMGDSGYEFGYGDMGPMTKWCIGANAACLAGTMTPVNPPTYSYYGIGIGINLGPTPEGGTMPAPVQLSGTNLTVKLSNLPTGGARALVNVGGTDYCAVLSGASSTIPWTMFNSKCYDSPPDGMALTAAPATPHIAVQAVSGAAVSNVDFCIETISWQ